MPFEHVGPGAPSRRDFECEPLTRVHALDDPLRPVESPRTRPADPGSRSWNRDRLLWCRIMEHDGAALGEVPNGIATLAALVPNAFAMLHAHDSPADALQRFDDDVLSLAGPLTVDLERLTSHAESTAIALAEWLDNCFDFERSDLLREVDLEHRRVALPD
jgi:hypothetical protein